MRLAEEEEEEAAGLRARASEEVVQLPPLTGYCYQPVTCSTNPTG